MHEFGPSKQQGTNSHSTFIPKNCTWSKKGLRIVYVCASTTKTKRAALTATVTMSGQLLILFIIFKGEANGRIAKKDTTFAPMAVYAVQKKCMDG